MKYKITGLIFLLSFVTCCLLSDYFVRQTNITYGEILRKQEELQVVKSAAEVASEDVKFMLPTFPEMDSTDAIINFASHEFDTGDISDEVAEIEDKSYWFDGTIAERRQIYTIYNNDDSLGSSGRLYIPDVGISVALYYCELEEGNAQTYTDRYDSAAYFPYGCEMVVADHNNQGFSGLWYVSEGMKAYIKTSSEVKVYTCTWATKGNNTGYDIVTSDGRSAESLNSGGICMYTCNENWRNITITFWQQE